MKNNLLSKTFHPFGPSGGWEMRKNTTNTGYNFKLKTLKIQ